jgi:hypothetical protein
VALSRLICLGSLLLLLGCNPRDDVSEYSGFALYPLRDPNLTAAQVWDHSLASLELADLPFLTAGDLTSYKWKTHEFTATPKLDSQLVALGHMIGPVGGKPFVVVVGNEKVYLGAFWYAYSSLLPQVPYIDVTWYSHQISKAIVPEGTADMRNDPRIYRALKDAGILIE